MIVYKNKEGRHPTTLAAVMTSVTKEERDYEYLARCLKAEGIDTLIYGTDVICALERGFERVFSDQRWVFRPKHPFEVLRSR